MNRIFLFNQRFKVAAFLFLGLFSVVLTQEITVEMRSELKGFIEANKKVMAQYVADIGWDIWTASWAKGIAKKTAKKSYGISEDAFNHIPWKFCIQKSEQIKRYVCNIGMTDEDIEYVVQGIEEFKALGTRDKNRLALFLYAHLIKKVKLNGTISRERLESSPNDLEDQVGHGVNEYDYHHLNAANFIIKYYLEQKGFVVK